MARKPISQKFDRETLNAYCEKNDIELYDEEFEKVTQATKVNGKCKTVGCKNDFTKSFRALVNAGPLCNSCSRKAGVEKCIETCKQRFGVEHASQSDEIKEKARQTNIENRGVAYPTQDAKVKEKIVETNRERRGVDNVFQDPAVRQKYKKTMRQNYGVSHPSKSTELVLKRTETKTLNKILKEDSGDENDD